jgi:hypothetical protein
MQTEENAGLRPMMTDESVRCPSCERHGYLAGAAELEKFVVAICHYCGCVLDRDDLAKCLARAEAERKALRLR